MSSQNEETRPFMSHPTYDDANMILRLYEMRREERLRKARGWFIASFKVKTFDELTTLAPSGSDENAYYRMVITYWDMAASFVNGGVLDRDLFFQSNRELLLVWERLKDVLPDIRERYKDPHVFGHLERLGNEYARYFEERSGADAYAAFLKRIGK